MRLKRMYAGIPVENPEVLKTWFAINGRSRKQYDVIQISIADPDLWERYLKYCDKNYLKALPLAWHLLEKELKKDITKRSARPIWNLLQNVIETQIGGK